MNIDESVFCASTNDAASGGHIRTQLYSGSGNTQKNMKFVFPSDMRLLHNTELYRVNITNSDYPSAQAFRYQNPTIGVLCLWGITEVASICM